MTHNHPIDVEGDGWLNAENLESGDALRTADGEAANVVVVEQQQLDESESVYNFTVEGFHTYFAEDQLVHNCPSGIPNDTNPNLRPDATAEERAQSVENFMRSTRLYTEEEFGRPKIT
ncbi:MAG: polymorphic toxin-type HINT domain-containing protein [Ardenticatenaceae bacterium]|nr:polymorphic toxin-type HINT domain-containing protein [Ardenticatenaceae bacterium]